jgi:hypothetical protein
MVVIVTVVRMPVTVIVRMVVRSEVDVMVMERMPARQVLVAERDVLQADGCHTNGSQQHRRLPDGVEGAGSEVPDQAGHRRSIALDTRWRARADERGPGVSGVYREIPRRRAGFARSKLLPPGRRKCPGRVVVY